MRCVQTNWAGDRHGKTWTAQGNNLAGSQVLEAMGKAFEAAPGELAEKLFAALKAGEGFMGLEIQQDQEFLKQALR
jgi:uncharacterized Ntn-hydrolase superfamily protein